jgi:hypothetical protein
MADEISREPQFAILSPFIAGAFAIGLAIAAVSDNLGKPPIWVLVLRTVVYAIAGGTLSLGCTIVWMIWYERSTGYSAGNAPLAWIFVYGPVSIALGQIIALVHWWLNTPKIGRKLLGQPPLG